MCPISLNFSAHICLNSCFCTADGNDDMFSLMVDHGGLFLQIRGELRYVDGTNEHFDECNCQTFSLE